MKKSYKNLGFFGQQCLKKEFDESFSFLKGKIENEKICFVSAC